MFLYNPINNCKMTLGIHSIHGLILALTLSFAIQLPLQVCAYSASEYLIFSWR